MCIYEDTSYLIQKFEVSIIKTMIRNSAHNNDDDNNDNNKKEWLHRLILTFVQWVKKY